MCKVFFKNAAIWRAGLVTLMAGLALAEVRVRTEVNRGRIYAGESFVLYVRVEGADAGIETPVVENRDAEVTFLGSQSESMSRVEIINGRVNEVRRVGRVFLLNVRPHATGAFKLGTVRVRVNGAWHEAVAPQVEVTGVEQQDFVHVTITGNERATLVDEPFTVTLEVRVRGLQGEYAVNEPLFAQSPPALEAEYLNFAHPKGLDGPDANAALGNIVANGNAAGFTINNFRRQGFGGFPGMPGFDDFFGGGGPLRFRPQHRTEQVGDVLWHVYTLATTYIGREEGEYQFGPVTFKGPVIAGVEVVNGRAQGMPRDIFAVGPALVVRVAPPPEEGRPNTFFGGVGKGMRARTELDTAVCKMGDPLTLTLDITGDVSLRNLRPPRVSEQAGIAGVFRVYDDSVVSSAIEGGRRFTYRVRPLVSGTIEFPALELSYYDVAKRQYATVRTQPIPLQVQATTQIIAEFADDDGLRADANNRFPSGITLSRHTRQAAWQRTEFWLMLALGPLLFTLCVAGEKALPQLRKTWKVFRSWQGTRTCHGALRTALDATQLDRAFRRFLAARMKIAGQSITPPEAEAALRGRDETAARETRTCLEQLAEAVYRREGGADFAALKESVLACVARLDALRAKPKTRRNGMSVLLLALLATAASHADEAAQRFIWEQANTSMAIASTRAEFLEAARLYARLPSDGGVMINMGVALLMAGEPAAAYEAFARAERRLGHTVPGLSRDVNLALRIKHDAPVYERPWTRVLFFWHYAMPMNMRLMLGAAGWTTLWLALLLWRLLGRRWQVRRRTAGWRHATLEIFVGTACVAGVALMLIFGASGVVSVAQEFFGRNQSPLEWVAQDVEETP